MYDKKLTIQQAAQRRGISEDLVLYAIRTGLLRSELKGGVFAIREWDIDTLYLDNINPQLKPSDLSSLAMRHPKAMMAALLFDDYFFALEVQYGRIKNADMNRLVAVQGLVAGAKEGQTNTQTLNALQQTASHYNRLQFLDIKLYFIIAENLRKVLEVTFKDFQNPKFQNIISAYRPVLGKIKEIRGMLEHLADKQINNPKIQGDFGNLIGDKFTFGGKKYDIEIESFRKIRDELSDFFIENPDPTP